MFSEISQGECRSAQRPSFLDHLLWSVNETVTSVNFCKSYEPKETRVTSRVRLPSQSMGEAILEVQDLSRQLDNGTLVFSNISFKVNQGNPLLWV